MEKVAALREELIARTRDVRNLMEERNELKEILLRRQREFDDFRKRVANGGMAPPPAAAAPPPARPRVPPTLMGRSWSFQVLCFFVFLVLEVMDWCENVFG
jgi:hypothetical protein